MEEDGHYAVHPRNMGGLGDPDHRVLERCIEEDLVIVTENARDFRALAARTEIHPGMIILPCVDRHTAKQLIRTAVAHLSIPAVSGFLFGLKVEASESDVDKIRSSFTHCIS